MARRQILAWTTIVWAASHLLIDPASVFAQSPTSVRGLVSANGQPLPGILVSDGCRVTRTDTSGRYQLAVGPDSGRFIFVTTPRGYWTDKFYLPLGSMTSGGPADFELSPVDQPDRLDFVFITDMHLERKDVGIPKLRASLAEISQLEPMPAFLWAQGDICLQGGAGRDFMDCLAAARMPVRNGAGNHEMILQDTNPRAQYEALWGPTYYSFDWGPIHCIVLDGNKPIPQEEGWKAVHGAVEGSELLWLESDLSAQPPDKPIIVGVHIPIVTTYPERRAESPKDAPYWEMTNDDRLTDLFSRYGVRLVLQGHMHENERATVKGVEYAESISISGNWWKSGSAMERGVDGCPRGYRVVSVDGNRISHRYRGSCESYVDRRGEFYELGQPIRHGQETAFVFNCYDAPNGSTARARIDEGPWQPMPVYAAVNQELKLVMPHHFRLLADTRPLPQGGHEIEAEVSWPDGTVILERAAFTLIGE